MPLLLRITVEKALEKDPAERYQTMRDFVVDLRRALRIGTAVEPSPVMTVSRNRPWLTAVAAMLALIAGTLLLVAFENAGDPRESTCQCPLHPLDGFSRIRRGCSDLAGRKIRDIYLRSRWALRYLVEPGSHGAILQSHEG